MEIDRFGEFGERLIIKTFRRGIGKSGPLALLIRTNQLVLKALEEW